MKWARLALIAAAIAGCDYYGYDLVDAPLVVDNTPDGGTVCEGDRAECDESRATVCETNIATSAENCGACNHSCKGGKCRNRLCVAEPISPLQAEDSPSGLVATYTGVCWSTGGGNGVACWDERTSTRTVRATLATPPTRTRLAVRASLKAGAFYFWVNPEEGVLRSVMTQTAQDVNIVEASGTSDVACDEDLCNWLVSDGHVREDRQGAPAGPGWNVPGAIGTGRGLDGTPWAFTATQLVRLPDWRDKTVLDGFTPDIAPVSLSLVGVVENATKSAADRASRLFTGTVAGDVFEYMVPGSATATKPPRKVASGFPYARSFAAPTGGPNGAPSVNAIYFVAGTPVGEAGTVYALDALSPTTPRKISDTPAREVQVTKEWIYFTDHDGTAVWRVAR